MGHTIQNLETRLCERDQVVAALTQRLEQAAEQLDRFQRTQRDPATPETAIETESASQVLPFATTATHDDVQRILEQWNAAQPQAALQRIETSLSELHASLRTQYATTQAEPAAFDAAFETESIADSELPHATESLPSDALAKWEQIKAQLFGEQPRPVEVSGPVSDSRDVVAAPHAPSATPHKALEIVEPPEAIEFDGGDLESLHSAISQRDQYIAFLIRRLRIAEVPTDWATDATRESGVTNEQSSSVTRLHQTLDEHLRLAEVELAMERARLSRESTRLKALNQRLTRQMTALDASANEVVSAETTNESTSTRRWLRFLGSERSQRS
ncbi:MAG: hypothetical protein ABGZ17_28180 [Planctomycetaceae bacterium]